MKLERINYKIDLSWVKGKAREVISEAVQKKAFSLGFMWPAGGTTFINTDSPYLCFNSLGLSILFYYDKGIFNDSDYTEISVNDWLNCKGFKEHESGVDFDFDNYKQGKIIKHNGKKYVIIEGYGCQGCSFLVENCSYHNFTCEKRKFKEIK